MVCKKCGAKIKKNRFFCDKCGASVGTIREIETQKNKDRKKRRLAAGVVLISAVFLSFAALIIFNFSGNVFAPQMSEPAGTNAPDVLSTADGNMDLNESTPTPYITPTPYVTPMPVNIPAAETGGNIKAESSYMYPSDTKLFTDDYLQSLDRKSARLARNEIYARHGFVFNNDDVKRYFSAKDWYKSDSAVDMQEAEQSFNQIERANLSAIVGYEKSKGWYDKESTE